MDCGEGMGLHDRDGVTNWLKWSVLIAFPRWENLRPHFKLITKPCSFSIFTPVRLSPPLILWSLPQPSQQPLHALCLLCRQCIPFLQLERSLLSKNLTSSLPCLSILWLRASRGPDDPSVLSTKACPSHMTH